VADAQYIYKWVIIQMTLVKGTSKQTNNLVYFQRFQEGKIFNRLKKRAVEIPTLEIKYINKLHWPKLSPMTTFDFKGGRSSILPWVRRSGLVNEHKDCRGFFLHAKLKAFYEVFVEIFHFY
jgi:hypothetical protein